MVVVPHALEEESVGRRFPEEPIEPSRASQATASRVRRTQTAKEPAVAPRPALLRADLVDRLVTSGVAPQKARALVQSVPAERIERQLTWIDGRSYHDRAATLVAAIERDYSAPQPQRSSSVVPATFDGEKFYRGTYALCPRCGCRPCVPGCGEPRAAGNGRR